MQWALTPLIFGHLTLSAPVRGIRLERAPDTYSGDRPVPGGQGRRGYFTQTATWYRMILARLGRAFESDQGVDELPFLGSTASQLIPTDA
jgi:hypothetical protein